jgi:hypothetical protein
MNIGVSINADAVSHFPLQKSFFISVPAELVRDLGDL